MSSWSKGGPRAAVAAACLAAWIAAALQPRDFPTGTFIDDAHYAVLAQSLREQAAYRTLSLPGAPPETKYPPGFPLLLAAAWQPGLDGAANLERLRIVNLVLAGPLAGALATLGLAVGLTPALAAGTALAGTLAPRFAGFWTLPLSEPLCVLLTAVGLTLWLRGRERSGLAALIAAVWVRTLAAPFVAAALWLAWRRDRRHGARLAAGAVLGVVPWLAWSAARGGALPGELLGWYGSYGGWLAEAVREAPFTALVQVPLRNGLIILRSLGESPGWWGWVPAWAASLLGLLLIGSAAWLGGRRAPLLAWGLAGTAIFVLWWPFPGDRFVAAAWPLVLMAVVAGLSDRGRRAVVGLCLGVALFGLARGHAVQEHRQRGGAWRALQAEIVPHLPPPPAVLATPNPALYYLTFGQPAIPGGRMQTWVFYQGADVLAMWGGSAELLALVRRFRPAAVITEGGALKGRPAADALARACPTLLAPRWLHPMGPAVFAVEPDAPCGREPDRTDR